MSKYHQPHHEAVTHKPTRFDGFTLHKTEHPYNAQKDSGRSKVLGMIEEGMTVAQLVVKAAQHGFKPDFVISCLEKHHDGAKPTYRFSEKDSQGRTLAEVKKLPQTRRESPEAVAKREQLAAEKAERARIKGEKEQAKLAEKEAKARARAEAAAKREAEAEAKKQAREVAKTAAQSQPGADEAQAAPKGRRVRRGAVAA